MADWIEIIYGVLAAFYLFGTLCAFTRASDWWIRAFDFPKLQMVALAFLLLLYSPIYQWPNHTYQWVLIALILIATTYHLFRIWVFTPLAAKQSFSPTKEGRGKRLQVLTCNVYQYNRKYDAAVKMVEDCDPDIMLFAETNEDWRKGLEPLKQKYPHTVFQPQENTYGLLLFSKLPILESEVRFLVEKDIPSIRAIIDLGEGDSFYLYGLHPRPPSVGDDTDERDAELVMVAKEIRELEKPCLVMGDLNDVAWSHTTRLFQRLSKLLDPRVGRGFFNTFPARQPLLGFPLDHIFHSKEFCFVDLKKMKDIGSDHLPVFASFSYQPQDSGRQKEPDLNSGDRREAQNHMNKV